jgi:hypothetical protein
MAKIILKTITSDHPGHLISTTSYRECKEEYGRVENQASVEAHFDGAISAASLRGNHWTRFHFKFVRWSTSGVGKRPVTCSIDLSLKTNEPGG